MVETHVFWKSANTPAVNFASAQGRAFLTPHKLKTSFAISCSTRHLPAYTTSAHTSKPCARKKVARANDKCSHIQLCEAVRKRRTKAELVQWVPYYSRTLMRSPNNWWCSGQSKQPLRVGVLHAAEACMCSVPNSRSRITVLCRTIAPMCWVFGCEKWAISFFSQNICLSGARGMWSNY